MSKEASPASSQASLTAQLQQAAALHQQGQLVQADGLYAEILRLQPEYFDALHLAGICAMQQGQAARAVDFLTRAIALNTDNSAAYANFGVALRALGRLEAALDSYRQALLLAPGDTEILLNQALVLRDLRRDQEALNNYERVLAADPDHLAALWYRGLVLREMKRFDEALASYDRALTRAPQHALLQASRGTVLRDLRRYPEALAALEQALTALPDYADAWSNHGAVLADLNRHAQALESYARALAIQADHKEAGLNRANALRYLGQYEAALAAYDSVLQHHPKYADAHLYRGLTLMELGRYEDALAAYARALAIRPEHAEARWNDALCRLLLGDFAAGWREYEARWDSRRLNVPRRIFPQALWLGADELQGKRLLIHAEQGFGDTLQFCRYVALLAGRGAEIIVEVQPELKHLLHSLAGIDRLLAQGETLPPFDLQCPMLSLPLACGTTLQTIPANVPYLGVDPARLDYWTAQLEIGAGVFADGVEPTRAIPRIGLAWRGSGSQTNDPRFLPFSCIAPLLKQPAQFACLHLDTHSDDTVLQAEYPAMQCFGPQLKNFSETAALIAGLDLVITIDTAVAHLAGALGKPVWILLPFNADWRWLTGRSDSPWYPSARLFRQQIPGAWPEVVAAVAAELSGFLNKP